MELVGALIAGTFIGAVLGFVGAGGAMLSVPILIYGFNFPPKNATVAALAIVFSSAFAGVVPKLRSKKVLIREATSIWALGLITNIGGALIARHLSDQVITVGFAFILLAAGTSMVRGPIRDHPERKIPFWVLILISLAIGALTGIFGVGGGFLAIPILVRYFHNSLESAAGTSLLIITFNCLTAFITHHSQWSDISWSVPLTMALAAILISNIASRNSFRVPVTILRRSFAGILYAIAIYSLVHSFINR